METNVASISLASATAARLPEPSSSKEQVGARASVAVKVPSWFTCGAALRVAQLKAVEHLLVLDRGVVVGAVSRPALAASRPAEPLARAMVATTATVATGVSVGEARALLASLGLDCLPVVSGPVLVGVVTREDLDEGDQRAA